MAQVINQRLLRHLNPCEQTYTPTDALTDGQTDGRMVAFTRQPNFLLDGFTIFFLSMETPLARVALEFRYEETTTSNCKKFVISNNHFLDVDRIADNF